MKRDVNRPFYSHTRIYSLNALSRVLGVPRSALEEVASTASNLYRDSKSVNIKSDGKKRDTKDAQPRLKAIQEKIKERILKKVEYPAYLQGSLPGTKSIPRGTAANAMRHLKAKIVINEDINNFFPSTTADRVRGIWKGLFGFSDSVADCLANLTTFNGVLPQGAKTSSYLANLAFWDIEPNLVSALEAKSLRYSRYVDDITVSARRPIQRKERARVISLIYGMLFRAGYRPKRRKHEIATPRGPMLVTKKLVNGKRPSIPKNARREIEKLVMQCVDFANRGKRAGVEYRNLYRSVSGKVGQMKALHAGIARKLHGTLREIPPLM